MNSLKNELFSMFSGTKTRASLLRYMEQHIAIRCAIIVRQSTFVFLVYALSSLEKVFFCMQSQG